MNRAATSPERMSKAHLAARQPRGRAEALEAQARRRHLGRRALVLLVAIAVPALAAPDEWRTLDVGATGPAEAQVEPMPFEQPGGSFPGAAFYYLAPDAPLPLTEGVHSDAKDAPRLVDPEVGPIARAMRVGVSALDRSRALECLTAAIYYEAASEPDQGQRAVAQVVLNRVAHPSFPKTVCGVVYQGSERTTGCQFSFACDGSLARLPNRYFWERAAQVARAALSGYVERSVGLATHYHTIAVHPYWDAKMLDIATIGAHRFFRFPGAAGDAAAFRYSYYGGEPVAAPHPRDARADRLADPALDPLVLERAYLAGLKAAPSETGVPFPARAGFAPFRELPAPAYSSEVQQRGGEALFRGDRLPQANEVRPEYRDSGRWIAQPGT